MTRQRGLLSGVSLALVFACQRGVPPPPKVASEALAASWDGGSVTVRDVRREAARLPPGLREQFLTPGGQREFVQTLVDRQLLFTEARARGMASSPEVQAQVRELEQRLAIQALLTDAERAVPQPSDAELQAHYAQHRDTFAQPARVHVARVFIRSGPAASAKLQGLRARLLRREPVGRVAAAGEGPERAVGGELGWVSRGGTPEADAALSLKQVNDVSAVYATDGGLAVLVLLERVEARVPPFDEVRSAVADAMAPARQRKAFDDVLARLRSSTPVTFDTAALTP